MPDTEVEIRTARLGESVALTELCRRSKAHWGYDAAFMRAASRTIAIGEGDVRSGSVLVAVRADGAGADGPPLGVAVIQATRQRGTSELSHLFVAPEAFRQGIGRALFLASVKLVRSRGGRRLTILSDPHAAGFYERVGALRCGEAPSDAVPGRTLPRFELEIDAAPR